VAQFGIEQGTDLINDISAGQFDPTLWPVVAQAKIPYILNYNRAQQNNTAQSFLKEKGIVSDALSFLSEKRAALQALGCTDVIIDPGFGFGKSLAENHELLQKLEHLHLLGAPLLVGVSRKSMITKVLNCSADEALNGTSILNTLAYTKGARLFRVHDVAAAKELILLLAAQDLH
jgi:dihydropteroate synthase